MYFILAQKNRNIPETEEKVEPLVQHNHGFGPRLRQGLTYGVDMIKFGHIASRYSAQLRRLIFECLMLEPKFRVKPKHLVERTLRGLQAAINERDQRKRAKDEGDYDADDFDEPGKKRKRDDEDDDDYKSKSYKRRASNPGVATRPRFQGAASSLPIPLTQAALRAADALGGLGANIQQGTRRRHPVDRYRPRSDPGREARREERQEDQDLHKNDDPKNDDDKESVTDYNP